MENNVPGLEFEDLMIFRVVRRMRQRLMGPAKIWLRLRYGHNPQQEEMVHYRLPADRNSGQLLQNTVDGWMLTLFLQGYIFFALNALFVVAWYECKIPLHKITLGMYGNYLLRWYVIIAVISFISAIYARVKSRRA